MSSPSVHVSGPPGPAAPAPIARGERRMLTLSAVLAAVVFSVVVAIPFLPGAKAPVGTCALEVQLSSSVDGTAQIYFDSGHGFSEAESALQPVRKSDAPASYRFPLPVRSYHAFRFDPLDRPGTVTMHGPLRIVTSTGRTLRTIAASTLQPHQEIESVREHDGRFEIKMRPGASDPQLVIEFSSPLNPVGAFSTIVAELLPRASAVFVSLLLLLVVVDRVPRVRAASARLSAGVAERPVRAVAMTAAVAVIASAYPVVFLGKSFVSPNYGTALLYDSYPTLPGYTSMVEAADSGSDMGAALWQHVPYGFITRRALAQGELPWWNRYNSAGTPLLAQAQSMFGDPLLFFVMLCDNAAWAWDVKYLAAKWLFAAGLGLCVLAVGRACSANAPARHRPGEPRPIDKLGTSNLSKRLGEDASPYLYAALLVTFAAPFVGFYVYRINHPAIFTEAYAPWVLLCWLSLARNGTRRATLGSLAGLLGANFFLLNSGTAKEASLLLLQMNIAGAAVLLASAAPWRTRLAKLAGAAWIGALLALVCAPVWLPFLQALRYSFTSYTNPIAYQIQPSLALGVFDELFFRPLSRREIVFNPALNFLLLLGGLYFVATLRLQLANRAATALAVCALGCATIVFGIVSPLWIANLPLLAHVAHVENCFLCGFIVLAAVLAGVGFATAAERLMTPEGRSDLVIAGLLLAALAGAWIGFWQASHRMVFGPGTTFTVVPPGEVLPVSPFVWGSLAALLIATVVLAIVVRRALTRGSWGAASVILGATCVLVFVWREGLHSTAIGFSKYIVAPPVRASFHAPSRAIDFLQTRREPSRVFGLLGHLTPGWNAVYGLEAIHGPDALQNTWLRELIEAAGVRWGSIWRLYAFSNQAAEISPFLDALNVRYYLDHASHRSQIGARLERVLSADVDVYESHTAWPRAFFTDRVGQYESPAELVRQITASNGRPFAAVQRNDAITRAVVAGVVDPGPDSTSRAIVAAEHYRLTANTTNFTVRASGPGVIVLTEAWWPGDFRVEVNGHKSAVLRVNHAFKGVFVDRAGEYTVTFRYVPKNFTLILALFAAGIGLLVASLGFALRWARTA